MGIFWDDVTVRAGTPTLTNGGAVVYDAGAIEGMIDQDDIFCPPKDGIGDRLDELFFNMSCYTIGEAPEDELTNAFGSDLKLGAMFSGLSSGNSELGKASEELDLDVDVSRLAPAATAFLGGSIGTLLGIAVAAVAINLGANLCMLLASPIISAKMREGNEIEGFQSRMGDGA